MRHRIEASPGEIHVFEFNRARLAEVRTAFARIIRHGEEQLHKVCELLCRRSGLDLHAPERGHRRSRTTKKEAFTLVKSISPGDLYSQTDLDLGTPAAAARCHDGRVWSRAGWSPTSSSAAGGDEPVKFTGHQPDQGGRTDLEQGGRLHLRFDTLVNADKQLRHLGGFVKDVFGVKAVVLAIGRGTHCTRRCSRCSGRGGAGEHGVPLLDRTSRLEFIEVRTTWPTSGARDRLGAIRSVFAGGTARSGQVSRCGTITRA